MSAPLVIIRPWCERKSHVPPPVLIGTEKFGNFRQIRFDLDRLPESSVDPSDDEVEVQSDSEKILKEELQKLQSPMILKEIKKTNASLIESDDTTWIRCVDEGDNSSDIKIIQLHLGNPRRTVNSEETAINSDKKMDEYSLTVAKIGYEKEKPPSKVGDICSAPISTEAISDCVDNSYRISNHPPAEGRFFNKKQYWLLSRENTAEIHDFTSRQGRKPKGDCIKYQVPVELHQHESKTVIANDSLSECPQSNEMDNLIEEISVSDSLQLDKKQKEKSASTSSFLTNPNKTEEFLPSVKKYKSAFKTAHLTSNKITEEHKMKSVHSEVKVGKIYRKSWRSFLDINIRRLSKERSNTPQEEKFQYLETDNVQEENEISQFRERGVDIGDLEKNLHNGNQYKPKQLSSVDGDAKLLRPAENQIIQSNKTETEEKNSEILNNQTCLNVSTLPHPKREKPEKINTLRPLSYPASVSNAQCIDASSFDGAVVAPENLEVKPINSEPYHQGHFVVVAVDFGTTFSGYAFSFTRDPENIHMMRKWEGGDPGVSNQKTPTCLLLTPNEEFHSFGFLARDYYHNLDPQEAKNWLYFDKFKMTLHHQMDLNRETKLEATNGKSKPALTIFTLALSYFQKHALQELSDQSATRILNEDIRWVITVPAIWRQPAKQFMRQAAYEAGLASPEYPDQLLIALEPEAASIYCRKLRMNQLVPEGIEQNRLSIFPEKDNNPHANNITPAIDDGHQGTRYIVVDCGGGTVDITVHEMTDKIGNLKELYKATGGPYGSVGVDVEFEKLIRDIFGSEFIDQFKLKRPAAYVDLMIAFEARKRNTSPHKTNSLNIALNFSFIDYYKKVKGSSVENAIRKYGNKNIRWSAQGMLRLEPDAMFNLFRPVIKEIIEQIEKVLSHLGPHTIQYLFLVGGFAESQILQHEIKNKFSSLLKVMIPQGVSLAILRGAVLYGLDPSIVRVRRSRLTYGVGVLNRFIRGFHPLEKMIYADRQEWCAYVFDKFVTTDQSIGIGDTILRSYTPANKSQKKITLHIYCTENDDAKFITDNGVRRCGTLNLDLTDVGAYEGKREIQTRMIFGDTEIKVSALDVVTQKFVRSEIDFL